MLELIGEEPEEEDEQEEAEEEEIEKVPLKFYFGELEDLFTLTALTGDDQDGEKDLTFTLSIVEVKTSHINLKLDFNDPIQVTPEDMLQATLMF